MPRTALLLFVLTGCTSEHASPGRLGLMTGAATSSNVLALGWLPIDTPAFTVSGDVPIVDGRFDIEAVEALEPEPPTRACSATFERDRSCNLPAGAALGMAYLFGLELSPEEEVPSTIVQDEITAVTTGVSESVVAVYATDDITKDTLEWSAFEQELPRGLSLMRAVPCLEWNPCQYCWPYSGQRYCLEPLDDRAQVLVTAW